MEKTSKIYIAGHRGMVGSAIVRRLRKEGYENLICKTRRELDLTRQADATNFFGQEKPEYVFLAAAMVGGIWANNAYPAEFIYSNLAIQTNVIQASYLNNVQKLVFLGSSCIYPKECPQPMKEEYLLSGYLEPTNEPYAIAKIAGIKMCQSYNRQYNTRFISVMPTNLYGSHDNFDLVKSHVLPALIRKFHLAKLALNKDWTGIIRDEKYYGSIPEDIKKSLGIDPATNKPFGHSLSLLELILWGTGQPRREFLHVDDLADACVFLMNNYEDSEIINIGTGRDLTIMELAKLIRSIVGVDVNIRFDSSMPDGTLLKKLDVRKLERLGWKSRIDLEDGIREAYQWYRGQYDD